LVTKSYVEIEDNEFYFKSIPLTRVDYSAIMTTNLDTVIISDNKIYNAFIGASNAAIWLYNAGGGYGHRNYTIKNNFIDKWGTGISLDGSSITGKIDINYNIVLGSISDSWDSCFRIFDGDLTFTSEVNAYNNIFLIGNESRYGLFLDSGIAEGGLLNFKNNIVASTVSNNCYYIYFRNSKSGFFNCDNNIYWNSRAINPVYYNGSERNWDY
jgi:hypothetical protein